MSEFGPPIPGIASVPDFLKLFSVVTERGAALAAAAQLDDRIQQCLRAILIPNDTTSLLNSTFGEQGALGAFGAKVRFAYLLGIISLETHKELLRINSIRNLFAHKAGANDFKYPEVQGHASQLAAMREPAKLLQWTRYGMAGDLSSKLTDPPNMVELWVDGLGRSGINLKEARWAYMLEVSLFRSCFEHMTGSNRLVLANSVPFF